MRCVCQGNTTGGPIAVIRYEDLNSWNGDDDYFEVLARAERDTSLILLPKFRSTSHLLLFRQESDGNFCVFCDERNLVILSEIYAAQDWTIARSIPNFRDSVKLGRPERYLKSFGGTLAVFDAAIPGPLLCEKAARLNTAGSEHPHDSKEVDFVFVNTEVGDWAVSELYSVTNELSYSGIWMRVLC